MRNVVEDMVSHLLSVDQKTADSFTTYMKKFPEMYRNLARILERQLPKDVTSEVILDVGCGSGLLLGHLQDVFPHSLLFGIDISSEMLRIANITTKQQHSSQVFFSLASSEHLPFKDCSFDSIVSRFSLSYWPHPSFAFKEMYRTLKPGGVLILEALNGNFPRWKLRLIKYKMICRNASDEVITYHIDAYKLAYTIDEIKQFITSAQLDIACVVGKKSQWKFIVIAKKL
jgi:ubiquinone/menaquinone biosynthesis C-methylase UbiE